MAGHSHRACLKIWYPNLLIHLLFPSFSLLKLPFWGVSSIFTIFKHSIYWYFLAVHISVHISIRSQWSWQHLIPEEVGAVDDEFQPRLHKIHTAWVRTSHHPIPRTPGDLPPKIINIDIYIYIYVHYIYINTYIYIYMYIIYINTHIYIYGTLPEDLRFKQIYRLCSIIIMIVAFFKYKVF